MFTRTTAIVEARKSCTFALSGFVAFLRHPRLDQNLDTGIISRVALSFWLLVFSFVVTAIFALLALPLIVSSSASPGDNLRNVFGQSAISVIVIVVILGPLIEEMMFRGWLTGTIPALAGSALFLAIVFGGSWLVRHLIPDAPVLGAQAGVAALGLSAFYATQRKEVEVHPAWYKRAFPIAF
ncbi:MAG TPA: CPBP family glutamic-type intramembrane protease, partial [Phycisphaerae bacterium]|nr:CPBP family glutamic-type intramembrane protease [Phycisphaerae bacterium]